MEALNELPEFTATGRVPLLNDVRSAAQPNVILRLGVASRFDGWNCLQYLFDVVQQLLWIHFPYMSFSHARALRERPTS